MRTDELDTTGQLLELSYYIDRLAEQCELERSLAWEHTEPPFDGEWMDIDE